MKIQKIIMLVCASIVQITNCVVTMQPEAERAVRQQNISLIIHYYNACNAAIWFQQLPEFSVFKVLGDLFYNRRISRDTVRALIRIDQSAASYPYVYPADPDLELIENAFLYVREHDLKLLQSFIVQNIVALGA